ncbi:hypothetical protein FNE25_06545 [Helicobacter pylori]|nr:hypothetical protein FNE25_04675 [Helicobacter pylori]WRG16742.1 hypothetical protein FNE25_06545 [Helicobacter pylori]
MASNHPIIQSFNHSIKQSFNQAIKQSSNQAIKQSSNQAIKQRYHVFITIFITFTKIRLKIFYFLLFPLSLTLLFPLSLTHTAIFLKNLIP